MNLHLVDVGERVGCLKLRHALQEKLDSLDGQMELRARDILALQERCADAERRAEAALAELQDANDRRAAAGEKAGEEIGQLRGSLSEATEKLKALAGAAMERDALLAEREKLRSRAAEYQQDAEAADARASSFRAKVQYILSFILVDHPLPVCLPLPLFLMHSAPSSHCLPFRFPSCSCLSSI